MKRTSEDRLLAQVAHLYYEKGLTQEHIAHDLSITRWRVGRLLRQARTSGIVSITINYGLARSGDLEEELQERFQLASVAVAGGSDFEGSSLRAVAQLAANLLANLNPRPTTLGISWGRTIDAVADALEVGWTRGIHIVQLNGALTMSTAEGPQGDPAQRIAFSAGGRYTLLPVPAIVDQETVRVSLEKDSTISQILNAARATSAAMFGLGVLSQQSVLAESGYISKSEIADLKRNGAVGDILGRYVDEQGNIVNQALDARTLGLTLDELREKPVKIGISHGPEKTDITHAALKAGLVSHLITDETIARSVLARS